jgi:hypothetical protein
MKRLVAHKLVNPAPITAVVNVTPRALKVAICVDMRGAGGKSPEEEIREHQRTMREVLRPHRLRFYQAFHMGTCSHGIKPGTDIVLFDYGGMMLGSSLAESNAREMLSWCQDNPNSLVLVMSSFTWGNIIEYELEQAGLKGLPNLVNYYGNLDNPIPDWFMHGTGAA